MTTLYLLGDDWVNRVNPLWYSIAKAIGYEVSPTGPPYRQNSVREINFLLEDLGIDAKYVARGPSRSHGIYRRQSAKIVFKEEWYMTAVLVQI